MICYRIAPNDLNTVRLLIDRPQTKQNLSLRPLRGLQLGARAFLKFLCAQTTQNQEILFKRLGLSGVFAPKRQKRRTPHQLKDDKKRAGGIAPPVFLCYHVIVTQQDSHIEFLGDSCI